MVCPPHDAGHEAFGWFPWRGRASRFPRLGASFSRSPNTSQAASAAGLGRAAAVKRVAVGVVEDFRARGKLELRVLVVAEAAVVVDRHGDVVANGLELAVEELVGADA